MLIRRVIPVLDIRRGRLVKGVQFGDLQDAGDPVQAGCLYASMGADALIALNLSRSEAHTARYVEIIREMVQRSGVPVIAGGGVRTLNAFESLLMAGASAVSVATQAIRDPGFVTRAAQTFGSERVMGAVDVRWAGNGWRVHSHGGLRNTLLDALDWCAELERRGAGQLMLVSMDRDGTGAGFDTDLVRYVHERVRVPLVVNGGAGTVEDFVEACLAGATAVTAASLFHFRHLTIGEVKEGLHREGFAVSQ